MLEWVILFLFLFLVFISQNIIIINSFRVFPISVSWWFSTGGWETASLHKIPGLFLVFWPISTMLLLWWSPLILLFPSPPKSTRPIIKTFGDPTECINYNWYQCQLHVPRVFQFPCKVQVFSLFSPSFSFTLWSAGTIKQVPFYFCLLLTITRSGRLAEIRWYICISKSQRILWVLFSRMESGLCI